MYKNKDYQARIYDKWWPISENERWRSCFYESASGKLSREDLISIQGSKFWVIWTRLDKLIKTIFKTLT